MGADGLYSRVLSELDPNKMLRTHAKLMVDSLAVTGATVPTNGEILDAAKTSYHQHMDVVDSYSQLGAKYVLTSDGGSNVGALNAYNWKSKQSGPITPTAESVYAAPSLQPAAQAAVDDGAVGSLVFGISESAQFILGEEGGVGVAVQLDGGGITKGEGYVAGKLGLDIDVAVNLNVAIWSAPVGELAGGFFGVEVNLDLEVGISLGIYVSGDHLQYMGFSVGIGAGLGGGATVVGGYTWLF
jgi:hypothetical protein